MALHFNTPSPIIYHDTENDEYKINEPVQAFNAIISIFAYKPIIPCVFQEEEG